MKRRTHGRLGKAVKKELQENVILKTERHLEWIIPIIILGIMGYAMLSMAYVNDLHAQRMATLITYPKELR